MGWGWSLANLQVANTGIASSNNGAGAKGQKHSKGKKKDSDVQKSNIFKELKNYLSKVSVSLCYINSRQLTTPNCSGQLTKKEKAA